MVSLKRDGLKRDGIFKRVVLKRAHPCRGIECEMRVVLTFLSPTTASGVLICVGSKNDRRPKTTVKRRSAFAGKENSVFVYFYSTQKNTPKACTRSGDTNQSPHVLVLVCL